MGVLMQKGAMNLQMVANSSDAKVELEEEENGAGGQVCEKESAIVSRDLLWSFASRYESLVAQRLSKGQRLVSSNCYAFSSRASKFTVM
jgi:hypothetical protein